MDMTGKGETSTEIGNRLRRLRGGPVEKGDTVWAEFASKQVTIQSKDESTSAIPEAAILWFYDLGGMMAMPYVPDKFFELYEAI